MCFFLLLLFYFDFTLAQNCVSIFCSSLIFSVCALLRSVCLLYKCFILKHLSSVANVNSPHFSVSISFGNFYRLFNNWEHSLMPRSKCLYEFKENIKITTSHKLICSRIHYYLHMFLFSLNINLFGVRSNRLLTPPPTNAVALQSAQTTVDK